MFTATTISVALVAPFAVMGADALLQRLFRRAIPWGAMVTVAVVAGTFCIASGVNMIASGWQGLQPKESDSNALGRVAAQSHGRGGVVVLVLLYWPQVLIGIGVFLAGLPFWDFLRTSIAGRIEVAKAGVYTLWTRVRHGPGSSRPAAGSLPAQGSSASARSVMTVEEVEGAPARTVLVAQAMQLVQIRDVDEVVQGFGFVVGGTDLFSTLRVGDERLLKHPKAKVRAALILAIVHAESEHQREQLRAAYVMLPEFQPGIGAEPVAARMLESKLTIERTRLLCESRLLISTRS